MEWASNIVVFLGILLNGVSLTLSVPEEKWQHTLDLLKRFKDSRKVTVKQLQALCGYLNFLCKAVFPGRPFLRCMYVCAVFPQGQFVEKAAMWLNKQLKPHHHIQQDQEFELDCSVWEEFLKDESTMVVCRPMIDLSDKCYAENISFSSDASAKDSLGFGSVFQNHWIWGKWGLDYIRKFNPSIEYLELYTLVAGILTWEQPLVNKRIIVQCDNQRLLPWSTV